VSGGSVTKTTGKNKENSTNFHSVTASAQPTTTPVSSIIFIIIFTTNHYPFYVHIRISVGTSSA